MNTRLFSAIAALLLLTAAGWAQADIPNSYEFAPLQKPGATNTFVRDINDKGQIVGSYVTEAEPYTPRHFLWERGTFRAIDLAALIQQPGVTADIYGINNRGQMVGQMYGYANYTIVGFITDGHRLDLVTSPIGELNWASSINNRGQIAGVTNTELWDSASFLAFERSASGAYRILDPCHQTYLRDPACYWFWAMDARSINDRGTVVGRAIINLGWYETAFVYRNGQFQYFEYPALEGRRAGMTSFNGINEREEIVGTYQDTWSDPNIDPPYHGFVYRKGKFSTLDYPGATQTQPQAIRADGVIAGSAEVGGRWIGFIAVPRAKLSQRLAGGSPHED